MKSEIDPESWTEQLCRQAPDGGRHHWVPKRDGVAPGSGGEPAYVQCCIYCQSTAENGRVIPPDYRLAIPMRNRRRSGMA